MRGSVSGSQCLFSWMGLKSKGNQAIRGVSLYGWLWEWRSKAEICKTHTGSNTGRCRLGLVQCNFSSEMRKAKCAQCVKCVNMTRQGHVNFTSTCYTTSFLKGIFCVTAVSWRMCSSLRSYLTECLCAESRPELKGVLISPNHVSDYCGHSQLQQKMLCVVGRVKELHISNTVCVTTKHENTFFHSVHSEVFIPFFKYNIT